MKYFAIFAVALASLVTIGFAQEPEPLPAEAVKVLKLFVGKYETTIDGAPELKGSGDASLVLGDRFVRDEFVLKDGDGKIVLQGTTIITYDVKVKEYRIWTFLSNGDSAESKGTWNEASRTLTTTSRNPEKQHTTTWFSTFAADGAEAWGFVTKDKDGNLVEEVGGKSTPRK